MNCWNCGYPMESPSWNKIPFRALCDKCGAALHCCRNCKNYKPGLPNDCMVPNTEHISDRSAINFCEEFQLLGKYLDQSPKAGDVEKKLFGDTDDGKDKGNETDRFNSLFKT